MTTLTHLSQTQPSWTLEEFVDCINQMLPQVLPQPPQDSEPLNPRLVRYYTSEGLIDRPERQGREVRYRYRHLLQALLVRRLLQDGYSLGAIASLLQDKTNNDLEALIHGGIQLTLETSNPALAFLQSLQANSPANSPARSQSNRPIPHPHDLTPSPAHPQTPPQAFSTRSPAPQPPDQPEQWLHLPLLPGLMLLVRDNFTPPQTHQEQQNLIQLIFTQLTQLTQLKTRHSSKR